VCVRYLARTTVCEASHSPFHLAMHRGLLVEREVSRSVRESVVSRCEVRGMRSTSGVTTFKESDYSDMFCICTSETDVRVRRVFKQSKA
jgi:hypothetical protein